MQKLREKIKICFECNKCRVKKQEGSPINGKSRSKCNNYERKCIKTWPVNGKDNNEEKKKQKNQNNGVTFKM